MSATDHQDNKDRPDVQLRGVVKRFGQFEAVAGIDLDVAPGQFVTLLGPSGCGKTTTLRMIGGFEWPDAGDVFVAGDPVKGDEPGQHTRMVFQSYALFPHMTVNRNVAFGLRMDGAKKADINERVAAMLSSLGLTEHATKYPHQLSGGQQQRVALARALVTQPRVLLLDEPLGALDLKMRRRMQNELKALQRDVGITFIYVTHDQEEAMNLSDVIVVMEKGRIVQVGTPQEIYQRPTSSYVADFIGETNFLPGQVASRTGETTRLTTPIGELSVQSDAFSSGDDVTIAIRPETIVIDSSLPGDITRGQATVQAKSFLGAYTRFEIDASGTSFIVSCPGSPPVEVGNSVAFGWRDDDALALPGTYTREEDAS